MKQQFLEKRLVFFGVSKRDIRTLAQEYKRINRYEGKTYPEYLRERLGERAFNKLCRA